MQVIVDTGTIVYLIKKNIVLTVSLLMKMVLLRPLTGKTSSALGEAEVEIGLGWFRVHHRVLVANIDNNIIMGMDLMGKYRLAYDPEERILKFANES